MHIVHSNIKPIKKAKAMSNAEAIQRERALKWMAKQYRKDYEKILKENAELLKEIHEVEPGWMPEMAF